MLIRAAIVRETNRYDKACIFVSLFKPFNSIGWGWGEQEQKLG